MAELETSGFGQTQANLSVRKSGYEKSQDSIISTNFKIGTRVIIKNPCGPNRIIYIDGVKHDSESKINRILPVHLH